MPMNSPHKNPNKRPRNRIRSDAGQIDTDNIIDVSQIPMEKLAYLNENHIYWECSKKRSAFVCQACDTKLATLGACMHHSNLPAHHTNLLNIQVRHVLRYLPPISRSHRLVLNRTLESALEDVLVDPSEMRRRRSFADKVMSALKNRIPNLQIVGTGSTWDDLAVPDSSVYFDVSTDACRSTPFTRQGPRTLVLSDESVAHAPGLGYLLSDIFNILKTQSNRSSVVSSTPNKSEKALTTDLLSSETADMAHQSEDDTIFPEIRNVTRSNEECFCISFMDADGVQYKITTNDPNGHHRAKLVHTYLNLDNRALQLATLFRKLCKLAYLDMPLNGTFPVSVLPILVIFYLQHTDPPILPNLQQLYRDNRDTLTPDQVYKLVIEGNDLSFITDSEAIHRLWKPLETCTVPDESAKDVDLSDLWLGFLRFYLYDFQKSRCAVSITARDPDVRPRGKMTSFVVLDPCYDIKNMTQQVNSSAFEYIHAQLLAAYAYFGVPRLTNGRHVFTNVKIEAAPQPGLSPPITDDKQIANKDDSAGDDTPRSVLHLTPIIDDTDDFECNLNKLRSLLAEEFGSLWDEGHAPQTDDWDSALLNVSIASDEDSMGTSELLTSSVAKKEATSKTLTLKVVMPSILKLTLDEILESEDVSAIHARVMEKYGEKMERRVHFDQRLTVTQFEDFATRFAKNFWSEVYTEFIGQGKLTVPIRPFVRSTGFLFSLYLVKWIREQNLDNLLKPSPNSNEDSFPETNEEDAIVSDRENQRCTDKVPTRDNKKDTPRVEVFEQSKVARLTPQDSNAALIVDVAPRDEDEVSRYNDETMEEPGDLAEHTLDLGEEDDIDIELPTGALSNAGSTNAMADASILQSSMRDKLLEAVGSLKAPVPVSEQVSSTEKPILVEGQDDSNIGTLPAVSSDTKPSKSEANVVKKDQQKDDKVQKTDGPKEKLVKTKQEAGPLKWENVIFSRDSLSHPIDDDHPDFYNSLLVDKLEVDHLSFQFVARGHLPQPGRHGIRSSVLGLAAVNQPSTLLAHFSAPEPQCKACGQMGHRISTCLGTPDNSVSFSAWKQFKAKSTLKPASPSQTEALGDCLDELARFHECTDQENSRQLIVDVLRQLFVSLYPAIQLEVFGSCANGFQLPSSDMDLCVFFPRDSAQWHQLKNVNGLLRLIRSLKSLLQRYSRSLHIVHIHAILHAKVPILKVRFENAFEVDISFSNYLALINTRLLKLYTVIEPRLRTLGVGLKVISKLSFIGNASTGGISSYALIIMLIHYLQQKDMLPVLQQLTEEEDNPTNLVEGWNVWYKENLATIRQLWKPTKSMSLGEMWLGFFHYYLFEFDHDVYVVCIRQRELLTRFIKMWSSLFAIEDPFNLEHNLTTALPRDSLLCILDVFHAVLIHHSTHVQNNMAVNAWRYSLFSPESLSSKRQHGAPLRSQCFCCRQCGHRASECPFKNNKRDDNNNIILTNDMTVQALIGPFLRADTNNARSFTQPPPQQQPMRPMINLPPPGYNPQMQAASMFGLLPTPLNPRHRMHSMSNYGHGGPRFQPHQVPFRQPYRYPQQMPNRMPNHHHQSQQPNSNNFVPRAAPRAQVRLSAPGSVQRANNNQSNWNTNDYGQHFPTPGQVIHNRPTRPNYQAHNAPMQGVTSESPDKMRINNRKQPPILADKQSSSMQQRNCTTEDNNNAQTKVVPKNGKHSSKKNKSRGPNTTDSELAGQLRSMTT